MLGGSYGFPLLCIMHITFVLPTALCYSSTFLSENSLTKASIFLQTLYGFYNVYKVFKGEYGVLYTAIVLLLEHILHLWPASQSGRIHNDHS